MKYHSAPSSIWKNPWEFLAFGLGSGAMPIAPGTFGTLIAIPFYFLLSLLPLIYYSIFMVAAFGFGCWLCEKVSQRLGVHDHSGIVFDEMVGLWLTLIAVPPHWVWIGIGFILFRFFDILKPWPISYCDKNIKGGLGIMLDDGLAAIPAAAILQLIMWIFN
ncbi:MAG: phosphatidylglycerophosphatase A [Legionellales bacterium]|nr:phosphatidylglycerophosphatase A [Legionellales bacterium]